MRCDAIKVIFSQAIGSKKIFGKTPSGQKVSVTMTILSHAHEQIERGKNKKQQKIAGNESSRSLKSDVSHSLVTYFKKPPHPYYIKNLQIPISFTRIFRS